MTRRLDSGYIPSLDGWRAVAVLIVMASHAQLLRAGPLGDGWFHNHGLMGVRIFFAISGILICSRLLREESQTGRIRLRAFYVRRVFRILPVALLFLAVAAALMAAGMFHPQPHWQGWWASLLFWRNFLPISGGEGAAQGAAAFPGWITAHFWSLSLEEQFYFLLPGMMVLAARRRVQVMTGAIALLFCWGFLVMHHALATGVAPAQALPAQVLPAQARPDLALNVLLLPALAAVLLQREGARRFMLPLVRPWPLYLVGIYAVQKLASLVHGGAAGYAAFLQEQLLAVLMTGLVLGTALYPSGWLTRLLEAAPLRWVGRISYSLYVWQQIFMTQHFAAGEGMGSNAHHGLNWLLTFACATASYYLMERPLVRAGHRLTAEKLPAR
jgi:peptidoglycan/LPS O-acetylase OafA/YrhL